MFQDYSLTALNGRPSTDGVGSPYEKSQNQNQNDQADKRSEHRNGHHRRVGRKHRASRGRVIVGTTPPRLKEVDDGEDWSIGTETAMHINEIDPTAIDLPPTHPIDITAYLPDPADEPTA